MSKIFSGLLCVSLAMLNIESHAQVFISKDPDYLKVKTEQNNLTTNFKQVYADTTVTNLNNFFPRNFMGNTGLPSPDYFFNTGTDNLGFRFFNSPISLDKITDEQVEYYRSVGPYADLSAMAGSKLLQAFKMLFTHTYKRKVNFTLRFNRYSTQGYFKKQQTFVNNFYLSSNYTSQNKRAGYYFYVLNNGNKNQENGGIRAVTLADSTENISKELFAVKLTGANRDNRETKLMVNPWLRINKIADTLHGINHYLQLKSKGAINAYKYKDGNILTDKYYSSNYLDTAATLDSSNVRVISNELDYSLLSADNKFGFSAGYRNEIIRTWQHSENLYINNILVGDFVYRSALRSQDTTAKKERGIESRMGVQYVLEGINTGDLKIENNSVYSINGLKRRNVYLNILYEKRRPDRIYNDWVSNHFIWRNNGYEAQQQLQAKLGLNIDKSFNLSIFYQNIYNYLYFDEAAFPRQSAKYINNTGLSVNYSYVFFKHVGFLANYTFQNTTNSNLVRVPANSVTAKLFYTNSLFKNALQLQVGSQVQVYGSFYAYGYMPATQVFYLQNSIKTAAFPYVDVFLNARIRPVSFFLKLENALPGLAGINYALIPGYYQPSRAFRFGLSWMFFD